MAPTATMDVGQDGVAIITLANPPVNALHPNGTLACSAYMICCEMDLKAAIVSLDATYS